MPSPLEVEFQKLVDSLDVKTEPTFALILDLLYRTRYSGAITLHCYEGVPKIAECGKPIRIDLTRRNNSRG
jgi:hypothetical protein